MMILGPDDLVKYPFVEQAGKYLQENFFDIEKIGTDPDLKSIVDKAVFRIKVAADGSIYKSAPIGQDSKSGTIETEIASFVLAVILIKLSSANFLIKHFSMSEAIRAKQNLISDLNAKEKVNLDGTMYVTDEGKRKRELAKNIIKEISGVSIIDPEVSNKIQQKDEWSVLVPDYVSRVVNFHERAWKLVNRKVKNGQVFLTSKEVVRLIRDELDNYIRKKISQINLPPKLPMFEEAIMKIKDLEKKFGTTKVVSTEYPPCIKHAIEVLEKGENLPHSGRFMLATFLLGKGQSVDQIAPLFKNAPDYNEKITLYQLNHLAGSSGSGTKYACPSCEKLNTQNLCFAIPDCDGIINPLQFRNKQKLNA